MTQKNIATAQAYYQAIGAKDAASLEKYLHPEVIVTSPMDSLVGKEAVLKALKLFMPHVQSITIRAACGAGDQVMLACDVEYPQPLGILKTAVLMTFKDGLIFKNEIFFDARPFEKKSA
ncbi:MAG: nuclear transport factor 2 family protein [Candidatus Babeliales bacterium]